MIAGDTQQRPILEQDIEHVRRDALTNGRHRSGDRLAGDAIERQNEIANPKVLYGDSTTHGCH